MASENLPTIDHLNLEAKRHLFEILARELLTGSNSPIAVKDVSGGAVLVYAVPADARARAERALREADPQRVAELQRRAAAPNRTFTPD